MRDAPLTSVNVVRAAATCQFAIVTSTFNAGQSLLATATSLRQQTHRAFQWIIVDGASTDGTAELARSLGSIVSILISEPDRGIYDAWNKALPLVSGDWVLFLGAGDELLSERTLAEAASALGAFGCNTTLAYGDVLEVSSDGVRDLRLRSEKWDGLDGKWWAGRPALPCHQAVFHRSLLFRAGFRFDTRCRISADNEILLREFIEGHGEKLDLVVARFPVGGISFNKNYRLRMVAESIYINFKVGIFFKRPFYQLAVLASNLAKHLPRLFRSKRA